MVLPIVHQVIKVLRTGNYHTREIFKQLEEGTDISATSLKYRVLPELARWRWIYKVKMDRKKYLELVAKEEEAVYIKSQQTKKKINFVRPPCPHVWKLNKKIVRPNMPGSTDIPAPSLLRFGTIERNPPHIRADLAGRSLADPPLLIPQTQVKVEKVPLPGEGGYLGLRIPRVMGRRRKGKKERLEKIAAFKEKRDHRNLLRNPPTTEKGMRRRAALLAIQAKEKEEALKLAEAEKDDWVRTVPKKRKKFWRVLLKAAKHHRRKKYLMDALRMADSRKESKKAARYLEEVKMGDATRIANVAQAFLARKAGAQIKRETKTEAKRRRRHEHKGDVKTRKEGEEGGEPAAAE